MTVQLETNDGKVLGSTKFIYKDEICSGLQKTVCSVNYGGKLVKALSNKGNTKSSAFNDQQETQSGN